METKPTLIHLGRATLTTLLLTFLPTASIGGELLRDTPRLGWFASLGIGHAHLANPEGVWHNFGPITYYGYGWTAEERANTWSIGLGKRYSWGALDLVYQDFGDTKSYASYPYDEGSPQLPVGCDYPCTPPQWVYHYGTAQGLTFSATPEIRPLRLDAALYARAGVTLYRATFEYCIADTYANPGARQPICQHWKPTYGITPAYGVGMRLGRLSLEVTRHHELAATNGEHPSGSFQRVDTFQLRLEIPFGSLL